MTQGKRIRAYRGKYPKRITSVFKLQKVFIALTGTKYPHRCITNDGTHYQVKELIDGKLPNLGDDASTMTNLELVP